MRNRTVNVARDSLFQSHVDPMWIYDLDTLRFLAVNDAAILKYGYSRAEFLAMTIADIRPAEDRAALAANVAAVTQGLDEAGVWRHCLKSGQVIHVDITGHTIEHDGRAAELIAARDVSRLVMAERTVHQALAREMAARQSSETLARHFESMFASVPGMFVVFSPESFGVIAASDAYLASVGATRADIVGRHLFDALPLPPGDMTLARLRESSIRVLATSEQDLLEVQSFLLPSAGAANGAEERYWTVSTAPVKAPGGKPIHLMLRLQDVTEAIHAVDEAPAANDGWTLKHALLDLASHTHELKSDNLRLAETATRLRTTQRLLDTGSWDYVLATDRLVWSCNVYDMYGVAAENFGHGFEDYVALVHPDDRAMLRARFDAFMAAGEAQFTFAHRVRHADGRIVHVHGLAEKIGSEEGPVLRGVVQNVTSTVEAAHALTRAERMLEVAGTSAKFGAWRYDALANLLEWSPQTARIHDEPEGFSPSLEQALAYYPVDHQDKIRTLFQSCLEHGAPFGETLEIISAKGRRIWVRASGEAEHDEAGRIVAIHGAFQDISELIVAQQKADDLSKSLAETLENIGDAFFTLDRDWRFTYLNSRAEALLKRERAGLIGSKILDEFPEAIGSDFETQYKRAFETGETVRFEQFFPPLARTFRVNAHPTPNGLAVYFSDITEERRRDEHLRLLDAAVKHIDDIVIITEATSPGAQDDKIVYVNKAFERRTGFTREEAIGRTPRILQGPKTQRSELRRIRDALETHTPVRAELINYTKSNDEYWLEIEIMPVANDAGSITHFVAVQRDITERRLSEEAVRVSEARFRLIAQATRTAVWEWNIADGQRRWNNGLLELFGHQHDPVGGLSVVWPANVHPDDKRRVDEAVARLLSRETDAIHESYRFRRADGSWATVEDHAFAIRDKWGEGVRVIGSTNDVSERAQLEDRLRQSQKLEAVGQLTGGVAHDFNNLLTIIIGNTELLQDQIEEGHPLRQYADMSAIAADRAAELTRRLLAFSRKQALQPRVIDVNSAIAGMEGMLRRTLGEDINIEIVRAGGLWRTEVDLGQLEAALLNLSINSRDAMPHGGALTIETANAFLDDAYVSTEPGLEPGQYVVIAVSDTGTGIPRDHVDRVFEPFFTTKPAGKGTGLGLSMVYGFVKQSGGHIRIYSEPNEGTTVKLYFPRLSVGRVAPNVEPQDRRVPGGHETILVVEDDVLILQQVTAQLRGLGYQVITASEGGPALAVLRERSDVDLLFTDVVLPGGMNGKQIADAAKDIRPKLRVLYTSGYSENAIVHHGRLDSDVELLGKPYRRSELAAKIRKVLDA